MKLHAINSLLGIILLILDIWVIINVMQSSVTARLKKSILDSYGVAITYYRYRFMVSTEVK
ncbi:MAG: hypothetical protein NMNS01_26760 [Nitrosomonas sp.]|jgi:hypothetical protein|nr:MAG: hypothetical protein NMNS01_26760 [Nitrosomonas sp.]